MDHPEDRGDEHAAREQIARARTRLTEASTRAWKLSGDDPRIVVAVTTDGVERTIAAFLDVREAELAVMCRNLLPDLL